MVLEVWLAQAVEINFSASYKTGFQSLPRLPGMLTLSFLVFSASIKTAASYLVPILIGEKISNHNQEREDNALIA